AEDIVVITPYRSNLVRLKLALANAGYNKVAVNTTDSFLAREGLAVIFTQVVDHTGTSGPLFVQDPYRICVSVTRHVGALFVVGDIHTISDSRALGEESVRSDTGQQLLLKKTAYRDFLQYFVDHRRIVDFVPPGVRRGVGEVRHWPAAVVEKDRISHTAIFAPFDHFAR
ncbi:hypothetical protein C8A00DRAFT_38130, partial [Chaetomidium leptoderma]